MKRSPESFWQFKNYNDKWDISAPITAVLFSQCVYIHVLSIDKGFHGGNKMSSLSCTILFECLHNLSGDLSAIYT